MATNKILDNTVISAAVNEIKSLNLISISSKAYPLKASSEVYDEISRGIPEDNFEEITQHIEKIDCNVYGNYRELFDYLSARYPYLHEGDISSFLLALLGHEVTGKKYYLVTDDLRLRKKIPEILELEKVRDLLKMNIEKMNVTGTIGLIKRLCEKGFVKHETMERIIKDLENSTFRITAELLKELRGCK